MEKGLLIEGIAKNVLVMLPKAKAIFKDTYGKLCIRDRQSGATRGAGRIS